MKRSLAGATAGLVLLTGTAAAAGPGTFKVVKTTKMHGQDRFTEVIAPSRKSAFAFGQRGTQPLAYRWNGERWSRSRLPKGVTGGFGQADATSASNVWVTMPRNQNLWHEPRPDEPCSPERRAAPSTAGSSKLLRWDGKRWSVARAFKGTYISEVAVVSARSVWAYGVEKAGPVSWHFNGKDWTRHAPAFAIAKAGVVSAKEIWAEAYTSTGGVIARFDGERWHRMQPPMLPTEPAPTKDTEGYDTTILGVSVVDREHVWVSALTLKGTLCGDRDMDMPLLRWTGKAWTKVKPSDHLNGFVVGDFIPDGSGGFYLSGTGSDTGEEGDDDRALFHRTSKGKWTRQILPDGLRSVAHIPGTGSLWGVGARKSDGAVWLQ